MPYGYDFNVTPVQVENGTDYQARKDAAAARKIELQQRQIELAQAQKAQKLQDTREAVATSSYRTQTSNLGNMQLPGGGYMPMGSVQGPAQVDRGAFTSGLQKAGYGYEAMQADQQFQQQDLEHQKALAGYQEQVFKMNKEQREALNGSFGALDRYFGAVDNAPPQVQPSIYAQAIQAAKQDPDPFVQHMAANAPQQFDPNSWQVIRGQYLDMKRVTADANKQTELAQAGAKNAETVTHDRNTENITKRGQNMTDARAREANQVAAGPGSQVTGDAFLQTLPAGTQAQVKAIAEGRMPLPNARSKQGMAMANAVAQAYPGFDSSKQPAYAATRKTFTSGTVADGINSFNTALNHLGRAYDNLPENLPVEFLNAPFNWVKNQTGSDRKFNRFNSDLTAVTSEVAKAYKKGVITEEERNDWLARLNPNSPTGKLKDNLGEIGQLLMGKLDAYQHQWDEAMPIGAVAPVNIVSKEAKTAFGKITGQVSGPTLTNQNPGTGSGGNEIHYKIVNGQLVAQ